MDSNIFLHLHEETVQTLKFLFVRSAWLNDEDGHTVAKINARLGAVTQLDVTTAEGLQVMENMTTYFECS